MRFRTLDELASGGLLETKPSDPGRLRVGSNVPEPISL